MRWVVLEDTNSLWYSSRRWMTCHQKHSPNSIFNRGHTWTVSFFFHTLQPLHRLVHLQVINCFRYRHKLTCAQSAQPTQNPSRRLFGLWPRQNTRTSKTLIINCRFPWCLWPVASVALPQMFLRAKLPPATHATTMSATAVRSSRDFRRLVRWYISQGNVRVMMGT
jgi:hypothetical protein